MVGPAPVIGSAVRYGYVPVVGSTQGARAVLVVPEGSAIADWARSKGQRLGLPGQDSVVTYLLRGEVNAMGRVHLCAAADPIPGYPAC